MINYWSEKIILKALEVNKPLNEVSILIEWITYRKWVKELYHSRNFALAKLLKEKWLNLLVSDEMYNESELKDLWFNFWKKGDIEFDCFSLEIK
jgi:UDP-N-acetyl-D-mannosaminuronic acid dehydrogenase